MSTFDAVVQLIYLASASSFVLGLHMMNSPATARRGNQLSAAGMTVAIATTVVVLIHAGRITSTGCSVLGLGLAGGVVWLMAAPASLPALILLLVASLAFGITMVLPIGGADMPVVISLLNAFTGTAVAMAGFVLGNVVMIIAGALVGASGSILTKLMADAMNRSLTNIMIGGFGTGDTGPAVEGPGGDVRSIQADDAAIQLAYAQKIIIVPGSRPPAAPAPPPVAQPRAPPQ